jgi:hypothetical protein
MLMSGRDRGHDIRRKESAMLSSHRLTVIAALTVALALPCTVALAQEDLRSPDARDAATQVESTTATDLRSPDAVAAGQPSVTVTITPQDLRSPDAVAAGQPVTVPAPVVNIEAPDEGFNWGDAAIGAAAFAALALLVGATGVLITRHHVGPHGGRHLPAH